MLWLSLDQNILKNDIKAFGIIISWIWIKNICFRCLRAK